MSLEKNQAQIEQLQRNLQALAIRAHRLEQVEAADRIRKAVPAELEDWHLEIPRARTNIEESKQPEVSKNKQRKNKKKKRASGAQ